MCTPNKKEIKYFSNINVSKTLRTNQIDGISCGSTINIGGNSTTIDLNGNVNISGNLEISGSNLFGIVGTIQLFAFLTPPDGWLECDGSAVSRITYSKLFNAIGITFGAGDGLTTFNLPDLRGEFVRGFDNGRGVDPGRIFGSSQNDSVIDHTHSAGSYQITIDANQISLLDNGATAIRHPSTIVDTNINVTGESGTIVGAEGGGVETRPRNIALLYCIKY